MSAVPQPKRQVPLAALAVAALLAYPISTAHAKDSRYLSELSEFERDSPSAEPDAPETVFAGATVLDRRALVEQILLRNPTIEAARQGWRSALARYTQRTSLDDPIVATSMAPISITGDARTGYVIGASQRIPFPQKLSLRGEATLAEADEAKADYELERLRLAHVASELFDEYFIAARSLDINAQHVRLLEQLKESATAQYETGAASQADLLSAEVQIAHLEHERIVLSTRHDVLVAQINGLLHRPPTMTLPPPPEELPPVVAVPDTETSEDAAARRPEIRGVLAGIERARVSMRLADRESLPDFEVMSSYNSMWGESAHRWMVGATVNIPIRRGRRRAAVAEAEADLARGESERLRLQDEIAVEIEQARLSLNEALHVVRLYETKLVPAARDRVESAKSGFVAALDSFLSVIEAEKDLRTVELEHAVAEARVHQRSADLDYALGRLPATTGTGSTR